MGFIMSFKDKILSKSGQFKYYKDNYEKLVKENEELKYYLNHSEEFITKDLEKARNERNYYKQEYETIKKSSFFEKRGRSFCNWRYIDLYYQDEFGEKFNSMLNGLDKESQKRFKLGFIRALIAAYSYRDSLFSEEEFKLQEDIVDFKNKYVCDEEIAGFKVIPNNYNLHGFMNTGLTKEDKEFIKNKDIIDAGAYIGDSALPFSKLTNKKVHAFEPFEDSYNIMKKNIKLNKIDNIVPIQASLSNSNEDVTLYLSGNNVQGITRDSSIREYDKEFVVKGVTIDSYVEQNNLDVGFIKIDVEGGEQDLLKGAINTIKTQKPILFVSIYHSPNDFFNIKPWIESLDLGYKFKISKERPMAFISDTILECRIE